METKEKILEELKDVLQKSKALSLEDLQMEIYKRIFQLQDEIIAELEVGLRKF